MKITHFISSPASGGAEVYVKDLSIAMVKLGHAVHVLFLSNASDIGRDCLYEEKFLTDLTNNGVKYSFIGNRARKNPFFGIIQLRKHIKNFKPNIFHCHLYYALIFSLFVSGTKIVYTHHNIVLRLSSIWYRVFDFKVSAYVGICHACNDMLTSISNKKVLNINNAVSVKRVMPKLEYNQNITPMIFMVGRFSPQKNYMFLLDVINQLKSQRFIVKIAGEGPEFKVFNHAIQERGLEDKIELLGNISNVADYMHEADIFAMTSSWEGLPISLIEATLSGLPCIVTDVGGCGEVISDCKNGFVIKSSYAHDYAIKLDALLDSFELRKELSKNALHLSKPYTIDSAVVKHIELYGSIL